MKRKLFTGLSLFLLITALLFTGCKDKPDDSVTTDVKSGTPTVAAGNASVEKTETIQPSVIFYLSSSVNGTWKVYSTETGSALASGITAEFVAATRALTLKHSLDIPANNYWVSVTETGKTESERLRLTVLPYTPIGQSRTPIFSEDVYYKTSLTDPDATFTLINYNEYGETLIWTVFTNSAGTTAAEGVTGNLDGPVLTLSKTGGIDAGNYYVRVKDGNNTVSDTSDVLTVLGVVTNFNFTPIDGLMEGLPVDTEVGTFVPVGGGPEYVYTLIAGDGATNNSEFKIEGDKLHVAGAALSSGQKSIRAQVSSNGINFARSFSFNVSVGPDITFDAGEGKLASGESTITLPLSAITEIPIPTLAGKFFHGWYNNTDFTGTMVSTTGALVAGTTYYAKWGDTALMIKFTVNRNMGYFPDETADADAFANTIEWDVPFASAFNPENMPAIERPGYVFNGWYTGFNWVNSDKYDETTFILETKTLYPGWVWPGYKQVVFEVNAEGTAFVGTPRFLTPYTAGVINNGNTGSLSDGTPLVSAVLSGAVIKDINGYKVVEITEDNGYIKLDAMVGAFLSKNDSSAAINQVITNNDSCIEIWAYMPDNNRREVLSFYRSLNPNITEKAGGSVWMTSAEEDNGVKQYRFHGLSGANSFRLGGNGDRMGDGSHNDAPGNRTGVFARAIISKIGDNGRVWTGSTWHSNLSVMGTFHERNSPFSPMLQTYFGRGAKGLMIYRIVFHDNHGSLGDGNHNNFPGSPTYGPPLDALSRAQMYFDPNGGNWGGDTEVRTITRNLRQSPPATTLFGHTTPPIPVPPTRDGHTFINWNTKADGTADTDVGGNNLVPPGNTTYYARWNPN